MNLYVYSNESWIDIIILQKGVTQTEVIDNTLDEATCVIKTSVPYEPTIMQPANIDMTTYYIIADINTVERKNLYTYTLTLIEPTKYLEKIILPAMAYTNRSQTLLEQMNRLLVNAHSTRFSFNTHASTILATKPSLDIFIDRNTTLREALDLFLASIDARCVVPMITDYDNIVIDIYFYNDRGSLITLDPVLKTTSHNIEFLGSNIEAYADNAFTKSRAHIYHPSIKGWTTFKTKEALLTSSNATIRTAFPIEDISSFIVRTHYTVDYFIVDTEYYYTYQDQEIDMVRNVVSKEIWDILPTGSLMSDVNLVVTEELYQSNTIYYIRGETTVTSQEVKHDLFFTATSFQMALRNAIYVTKKNDITDDLKEDASFTIYNIISYGGYSIANYNNALFRIAYQPYIAVHTSLGKENYSAIDSTIIDSQSDSIIDIDSFGRNLQSKINRLGNREVVVDTVNVEYQVGDYTADGYVVIKKTKSSLGGNAKYNYVLSKDFTQINTRIAIDRRKRIYKIPLESITRDILVKKRYLVTKTSGSNDIGSHIWDLYSNITNAIVRTKYADNTYSEYYELSVVGYVMGNSIHIKFGFEDNYSAGMSVTNQVIGGVLVTPNPYVDGNGEYVEINIILISDLLNEKPSTFAVASLLPKTNISYYDLCRKPINDTLTIYKDAEETHSFTYIFEIVPDTDVVIGQSLIDNNGITNQRETLYVWISDDIYIQNEQFCKGTRIGLASFDYNRIYASQTLDTHNSVAFGNYSGDLYCAVNSTTIQTLYILEE